MNIKIKRQLSENDEDINAEFIPVIADESETQYMKKIDVPDTMAVLPLRNMVMFPGVIMSISIGRPKSLKLIKTVYREGSMMATFTQFDPQIEEPDISDINPVGTIVKILKIIELPDGSKATIVQGLRRCSLYSITETEPFLKGKIIPKEENESDYKGKKFIALIRANKELALKIIKYSGTYSPEASFTIRNIEKAYPLINFICANFNFSIKKKLKLLETDDFLERSNMLLEIMTKEVQLLELKVSIQSKAQEDINKQQKEYFLQQQMKTIQDELGGNMQDQDFKEMKKKAAKKKWDQKVAEVFEKELNKLQRSNPHSPDYSVQENYLSTLLDLPWNEYSKDNFNLKRAERILNRDHYGMEDIKERILEHIAILKLKNNMKSPIICLYGPPGVGKTSLGKSIAESLNRKYVRMSLGGLNDEAEIRGHRRTYIGAMPGRIIQNLLKAGTSNPVFILDEIDKIGNDYKGDPSTALLEVLDPEQNNTFHDNFVDLDYDLSKVMFIATANDINRISEPLRDRMEMIEITGYLAEEKTEIASRHLIKKEMENNGIPKGHLQITKPAIRAIIDNYTRESGVRLLEKNIAKIMRKAAAKIAVDHDFKIKITPDNLNEYLGFPIYSIDIYEGNEYAGLVTGLAWTAVGGTILYIESSINKGKGGKLTLTGNLGDVMKESAVIALDYVKAHAKMLNIENSLFENWETHIHVPEGAIPKDGPSAGITMVTSLASTFTQRKIKKNLAMTGEITLRGKVLPVGGVKEKILAAKRSGIKEIILCKENKKDIEKIKAEYIKGLTFHYVKDAKEVLDIALLNEKVNNPVSFTE